MLSMAELSGKEIRGGDCGGIRKNVSPGNAGVGLIGGIRGASSPSLFNEEPVAFGNVHSLFRLSLG